MLLVLYRNEDDDESKGRRNRKGKERVEEQVVYTAKAEQKRWKLGNRCRVGLSSPPLDAELAVCF